MKKHILKHILPPFFTIFILLSIFFIKNIFPFGIENISSCDMSQLFVPMYTHLYDVLHGTKSLFFDWYSAGGNNMAGIVSFIGLLNPINLFFYFVPRENILEYMSLYLMLKMALSTLTMSFYLSKRYIKLETFWHVIFCIIYVFSGYILQYYTNINWLDFTILFPLLILSLDRLLKTGKFGYYLFTYTLCLITNIYLSFMVTIFIIMYTGLYTLILMPKKIKKQRIFVFALSSALSLMLSSWLTVPAMLNMVNGVRTKLSTQFLLEDVYSICSFFNKFLILLCLELPFIFTLKLLKHKNKKSIFLLSTTALVLIPIIIERINLMWHTGSYIIFPMRFGFILGFMLISSAAYYLTHYNSNKIAKNNITHILIAVSLLVLISLCSFTYYKYISWQSITMSIIGDWIELIFFLFFIIAITFLYVYILKINKTSIKKFLILIVLSFEIIFTSYGFIGSKTDKFIEKYYSEQSDIYIEKTKDIKSNLNLPNNKISRVKCKDFILASNYPYILGISSLANWTNMINSHILDLNYMLGYPHNYTRLLDYGGTVFSDALLNYDYVLSKDTLNEKLYEKINESEEFKLYKTKISLPPFLTFNKEIKKLKYENPFQYQNLIFNNLFNKNLIDILPFNETVELKEESILYVYYLEDQYTGITYKVNDKEVYSIKNKDEKYYQKAYGGIIELGSFNNEIVNIEILSDKNINKEDILLGIIPISKLDIISNNSYTNIDNFNIENLSLEISLFSNTADELLLLPVAYDNGWNVYINNEKIQPERLLNNAFIGIPLKHGINNIKMQFFPYGMKLGIIFSIIGIIFLIIYRFIKKWLLKLPILTNSTFYIFYALLIITFSVVYIFPVLYNIFVLIC